MSSSDYRSDYRRLIGQIRRELNLELDGNPDASQKREILLRFTDKLSESEDRFIEIHQKHKLNDIVFSTIAILIYCFLNWVNGNNDLAFGLLPFLLFYFWVIQ